MLSDGDASGHRVRAIDQNVVKRTLSTNTKRNAYVALSVCINQKYAVPSLGYSRREIHCSCGFSGAALLIQNSDAARTTSAEAFCSELLASTLQGAEVAALTVRGGGDLVNVRR